MIGSSLEARRAGTAGYPIVLYGGQSAILPHDVVLYAWLRTPTPPWHSFCS